LKNGVLNFASRGNQLTGGKIKFTFEKVLIIKLPASIDIGEFVTLPNNKINLIKNSKMKKKK